MTSVKWRGLHGRITREMAAAEPEAQRLFATKPPAPSGATVQLLATIDRTGSATAPAHKLAGGGRPVELQASF